MAEQPAGIERLTETDRDLIHLGGLHGSRAALDRLDTQFFGSPVQVDWLAGQYELGLASLAELGLGEADGIPAFEPIRDAVTREDALWLNWRRSIGCQDRLLIPPSVQKVGLKGTKQDPGLTRRFESNQKWWSRYDTLIDMRLWGQFDDHDPVHDDGSAGVFPVVIGLGDIVAEPPEASEEPPELLREPGLVGSGMDLEAQKALFAVEQTRHAAAGRRLGSFTVPQFVVANVACRLEGRPWLSSGHSASTRLVHYPLKSISRFVLQTEGSGNRIVQDRVPTLRSVNGRRMMLEGSDQVPSYTGGGYRRAVVLDLHPSAG